MQTILRGTVQEYAHRYQQQANIVNVAHTEGKTVDETIMDEGFETGLRKK